MTLDLGFSSFRIPRIGSAAPSESGDIQYQITLVDCPGHASLFKTILGGVHIIDAVVLVVDVVKGLQPQTIECLLVASLSRSAARQLVIALNKVDMIPCQERDARVRRVQRDIQNFLSQHFGAAVQWPFGSPESIPMVPVAAAPSSSGDDSSGSTVTTGPIGVELLVDTLQDRLVLPTRDVSGPLAFAVDHCFAIPGNGTILTGTVLSGSVRVGDEVELPGLQLTRKVKSMQMFRRNVTSAAQGDRVALKVHGLDASLVERTMVVTPQSVPFVSAVVIPVHQVPFFQGVCKTGGKFHATIGHTTVVAHATFFTSFTNSNEPQERGRFDLKTLYRHIEQIERLTVTLTQRIQRHRRLAGSKGLRCYSLRHLWSVQLDRLWCALASIWTPSATTADSRFTERSMPPSARTMWSCVR
ncbi:hypothetical protein PINS_up015737 [Pythium insidiosum]|nr:hypothetical protein PINS_up015737 [Pythium insidiosum]